ncbi:MAG TPA: hypothetical protein PLY68_05215 [Myxococcota bacterium]|nr:hypothetical protein [Myxococcota bacterium]HPB51160.1 hypothetical protein [Myxococcota bacterium]HQP95579.1 hypothetical protein [Myxococcota bacterium]
MVSKDLSGANNSTLRVSNRHGFQQYWDCLARRAEDNSFGFNFRSGGQNACHGADAVAKRVPYDVCVSQEFSATTASQHLTSGVSGYLRRGFIPVNDASVGIDYKYSFHEVVHYPFEDFEPNRGEAGLFGISHAIHPDIDSGQVPQGSQLEQSASPPWARDWRVSEILGSAVLVPPQ